ncbi:MAG: hypothetical protein AAGD11_03470 [Planctomycetota bacterium]
MALLVQFLLRLTFGLALGMLVTSSKQVTSGYFRNHLYVTLGLSALAALLAHSVELSSFWYAVVAAAISYVASVMWLYEKHQAGKALLGVVSFAGLAGAFTANQPASSVLGPAGLMRDVVPAVSGLLLGVTMAAMLLGHWYLNAPGMKLEPLQLLIRLMGISVALQLAMSTVGVYGEITTVEQVSTQWILFVALRWTFGIIGVAVMTWMAWQTLKIPNTQSATGILYVAVIGTFVGETMALLLSTESMFPL